MSARILCISNVRRRRTSSSAAGRGAALRRGAGGAVPPLVGWAAVTGSLTMPAFFLFAIVFFWTPPHFWALSLARRQEYARAAIPMLPVVYGDPAARWHIFLYSIQLVALTLLLPGIGL